MSSILRLVHRPPQNAVPVRSREVCLSFGHPAYFFNNLCLLGEKELSFASTTLSLVWLPW